MQDYAMSGEWPAAMLRKTKEATFCQITERENDVESMLVYLKISNNALDLQRPLQ